MLPTKNFVSLCIGVPVKKGFLAGDDDVKTKCDLQIFIVVLVTHVHTQIDITDCRYFRGLLLLYQGWRSFSTKRTFNRLDKFFAHKNICNFNKGCSVSMHQFYFLGSLKKQNTSNSYV